MWSCAARPARARHVTGVTTHIWVKCCWMVRPFPVSRPATCALSINTHFPTDEQPQLSMAGDQLFGGHWMFGIAHQILNRAANRGASAGTPITTSDLPHIITSSSSCSFSASHYCSSLTQDGDARTIPGGFISTAARGKSTINIGAATPPG